MDLAIIAGILVGKAAGHNDIGAIVACLRELVPSDSEVYGYLTWRYDASRRATQTEERLTNAQQDLVALAIVIDHEKQLLDTLVRSHGSILTQPKLAIKALENEFHLLNFGSKSDSASFRLQGMRAGFDFLRRAIVLSIACSDNGESLRMMLRWVRAATEDRPIGSSPQTERATSRLTELITSIERLLDTNETVLAQFFHESRMHLVSLQLKRYDFLRPFRDSAAVAWSVPRAATADLPFLVLPKGEQLHAFLGDMRLSKRYGGYRVDEHRLTVLEDLQDHFGAQRCVWHTGSGSSDGIGNRYLVLAIKSSSGSGEDAVAISPLAGQHATYVVRHDCAEADWKTLFAHPKFEARLRGARKLLFTSNSGHTDPYSAMRDKVIDLLERHPRDLEQRSVRKRKARSIRRRWDGPQRRW